MRTRPVDLVESFCKVFSRISGDRSTWSSLALPPVCPRSQLASVLAVIPPGPGCERVGGKAAEAGVRPAGVVVGSPLVNDTPSGREPSEQVLVEALVAEAAIEALDEAVSRIGLPGAMECHSTLILLPLQDGA